MNRQLEFDFETKKDIDYSEIDLSEQSLYNEPYYRINKYADWWCDHVPRCLGYGVYDSYRDFRRWCISSYQKWRYGVSDEECWSLAHNFANYILPRLKHFRKMNRMGVPSNMFVKIHPLDEIETELGSKRWDAILDEMIWTFEYILDDERFNPIPDTRPFRSGKIENIVDEMNNKCPEEQALWDAYFEKSLQLNERKQKGLKLFAEHFDSLWD